MNAPGDPAPLFTYDPDPQPTSMFEVDPVEPDPVVAEPRPERPSLVWNSGTDLGLLLLRLVLGGTFLAHGLRIVLGLFGGRGIDGFARGLAGYGYASEHTITLAWLTGIGEISGGAAVLFGAFTPFAAAGLLAIAINSVLAKWGNGFFVQPAEPAGFEVDVLLAAMSAVLVWTGPGRMALDNGRVWFRRPVLSGWISLVAGVGAGLLVYFLLRSR